MKTNSFIGRTGLWAVGLCLLGWAALAVSCTGMGREELTQGENASLTVTLSGQVPVSKAVGSPDDAEAVKEAENKLHNVTVFVFNSNGTLDKKHTFAPNQISETITGLVAGTKKVVVVANVPSAITFPDSINYGWFEDAGNVIDLDTQATTADGLFMSGEDTVVLSANTVSEATIPISRVVAKVKLGTLTIAPEAGHDAAKFALTKVMVMKARSSVKMGLPSVDYTPDAFYGGMQGDKSTVKTYLAETISTGDYANRYFYVLPSDNGDGNTTLITLAGTYDGQPVYFPFRINDTVGSDGATSDGTFIRRNSVYVVNKKSTRSMITMMAGAVSNCIMNYFFIKWWGPVGATYASFLGLALVFTLRAIDAHRMIGMQVHPGRVLANAAALVIEAFVLLAETPLYGLWTGIITALIILYNFAGVWAMARVLLPKLLGRRGKALVNVIDGWIAPKKA